MNILDKCRTGDIVLFNGNYYASNVVDYVTGSKWSHVGMILRDPPFLFNNKNPSGLFLYESDGTELTDIDSGNRVFGVQLVDLKKKIQTYNGTIGIRRLHCNKSEEEMNNILKIAYNTTYHKSYDWNIIDMIDPIIYKKYWIVDKIFHMDHRRTDSFFCSAFVAYLYTQLGFLKNTTDWSLIYPQFFADVSQLEDGCKLGKNHIIK